MAVIQFLRKAIFTGFNKQSPIAALKLSAQFSRLNDERYNVVGESISPKSAVIVVDYRSKTRKI